MGSEVTALKKYGEALGRAGLAARALQIIEEAYKLQDFKRAIEACGQLSAIAVACRFDDYWDEKATKGYYEERDNLEFLSQQRGGNGD